MRIVWTSHILSTPRWPYNITCRNALASRLLQTAGLYLPGCHGIGKLATSTACTLQSCQPQMNKPWKTLRLSAISIWHPSKTTPRGDAGLTWSRLNRGACGSTPEIHGSYAVLHDIFLACMMLEPNIDPWLLHILQNNLDFGRGAHSKVVHSPRGHVIPPLLGFLVSCRLAINFFATMRLTDRPNLATFLRRVEGLPSEKTNR